MGTINTPIIEVKEEIERFLNAIHALLPSRNCVSQYLFMMPKDYPTMYELYPEFLADPLFRERMGKAFGIEYGSRVECRYDSLSGQFINFMNVIFRILETRDVRLALCEILGVSDDVLLHPKKEWIKARIEGLMSDKENWPLISRVLKILSETMEPYKYWRDKMNLCEVLKINPEELNRLIRYPLVLGLVSEENKHGRQGYSINAEIQPYTDYLIELLGSNNPLQGGP
jgi:hypothetical protein